jgi:hypothetical protein
MQIAFNILPVLNRVHARTKNCGMCRPTSFAHIADRELFDRNEHFLCGAEGVPLLRQVCNPLFLSHERLNKPRFS